MAASPITFTLDLEDHRPIGSTYQRYEPITLQILDRLAEVGVRGTFFVVGNLARANPKLIKDIADAEHEVACHSLDHTPLTGQTREEFRRHTAAAKQIIEDASGHEVVGYRAPLFSLTKESVWAVDILQELGFLYSSSVLPARNPLHGFPGMPHVPFRWRNDLLEIPVPIQKFGPVTLPFLGGIYFRYLPLIVIEHAARRKAEDGALWLYCHPYDFDPDEPYCRFPGASMAASLLLWMNRRNTCRKLDRLIASSYFVGSKPLKERVADGEYAAASVFEFKQAKQSLATPSDPKRLLPARADSARP